MNQKRKVSCPNCDGAGFLNDAAGAGWTTPCPVCLMEGEIPWDDAVDSRAEAVPRKAPPPPPPS